jgi:TPR repeat protein
MYFYGQGIKRDHSKAVELYKKACDDGNTEGCKNHVSLKRYGF